MRKCLVFLLFLISSAVYAAVFTNSLPINNGYLVNRLDARGNPIINLGPSDGSQILNLNPTNIQQAGAFFGATLTWNGSNWAAGAGGAATNASLVDGLAGPVTLFVTNIPSASNFLTKTIIGNTEIFSLQVSDTNELNVSLLQTGLNDTNFATSLSVNSTNFTVQQTAAVVSSLVSAGNTITNWVGVLTTNLTNYANSLIPGGFDGTALTNYIGVMATNSTNFSLFVGGSVSNYAISSIGIFSTNSTNFSFLIGANSTNFAQAVGVSVTNMAGIFSTNSTNFSQAIGVSITNWTAGLSVNGTNFAIAQANNAVISAENFAANYANTVSINDTNFAKSIGATLTNYAQAGSVNLSNYWSQFTNIWVVSQGSGTLVATHFLTNGIQPNAGLVISNDMSGSVGSGTNGLLAAGNLAPGSNLVFSLVGTVTNINLQGTVSNLNMLNYTESGLITSTNSTNYYTNTGGFTLISSNSLVQNGTNGSSDSLVNGSLTLSSNLTVGALAVTPSNVISSNTQFTVSTNIYESVQVLTNETLWVFTNGPSGITTFALSNNGALFLNGYQLAENYTQTYYVSPTGTANTNGTEQSPWSVAYLLTHLRPGLTAMLMDGIYTVPLHVSANIGGTPALPITFKAQHKWAAIINNQSFAGIYGNSSFYQPYFIVDGICVSNCLGDGIDPNAYWTIQNCWVTGNLNQGINGSNPNATNMLIQQNLIESNGFQNATISGHWHGLYMSGFNNVVRGNVFRNNTNGYGMILYSEVTGATPWNNQVYDNLIYGNTNKWAMAVWGANNFDASPVPGTNFVFNNTLDGGIFCSKGIGYYSNNIILPSGIIDPTDILDNNTPYQALVYDYNLSSIAITPAGSGNTPGTHNVVNSSLGFVNTNSGLYWLTAASPARGISGTNNFIPPVDFFGNASTSISDVGAFQFSPILSVDTRLLYSPPNPDYFNQSQLTNYITYLFTTGVSNYWSQFTNQYVTNVGSGALRAAYLITNNSGNGLVISNDMSGIGGVQDGITNQFWGGAGNLAITGGGLNLGSGVNAELSDTSGSNNVAFGPNSSVGNQIGNFNNAFGFGALKGNTGNNNNAFGWEALNKIGIGVDNSAFGHEALLKATDVTDNVAFGSTAFENLVSGSDNVGVGFASGLNNTSGSLNTFLGHFTGRNGTAGSWNTYVGAEAGWTAQGNSNTSVGYQALENLTNGNGNIALGYGAGVVATNSTNNIYIGNAGVTNENGAIRIGTASLITNGTYIAGTIYASNAVFTNVTVLSGIFTNSTGDQLNGTNGVQATVLLIGANGTNFSQLIGTTISNYFQFGNALLSNYVAAGGTLPAGAPVTNVVAYGGFTANGGITASNIVFYTNTQILGVDMRYDGHITASGNFTFTAPIGVDLTKYLGVAVWVTNSSGSPIQCSVPSNWKTNSSDLFTVTNVTKFFIQTDAADNVTNCLWQPIF